MARNFKEIITELVKTSGSISGGNSGTKEEYTSLDYQNSLELLKDKDTADPFYIMMPGVTDVSIQKLALDVSDYRGNDCRVILDAPNTIDESIIVENVASIDNAWGECVAGWVVANDMYKNKEVQLPPTVLIARALYDAQDKSPYGSVAGSNRGVLKSANDVVFNFKDGQKLTMQAGRINPVINKRGVVMVYNNMTLKRANSVYADTNTVNVNCALKKAVLKSTEGFLFEDNREGTWRRWVAVATPILDSVKKENGIYDYKILMGEEDGTINATDIDTGYMKGIIKFKPTREAKWIPITFNAYSYGVSFETEF